MIIAIVFFNETATYKKILVDHSNIMETIINETTIIDFKID